MCGFEGDGVGGVWGELLVMGLNSQDLSLALDLKRGRAQYRE